MSQTIELLSSGEFNNVPASALKLSTPYIAPVRYALGDFSLDTLNINYPSIDALLNNQFKAVNGVVARLLRSGYVYIYIDEGASKQADTDGDDLPSYQDKWHIFYSHNANPDEEGHISEIGGLFTKQLIEKNDHNNLVYRRFKNAQNQDVQREYTFIPPTCSTVYIAYSAYQWSMHLLDKLTADASMRDKHMQKVGTMLGADEPCSWPLQLFGDDKPTHDNIKHGSSEQFKTTLARFVQELNPAIKTKSKNDSQAGFLDKIVLSATPAIPYSKAKIDQVHNATRNKIEIGKVVALHDPVAISQDLAAFHGAVSVSHADDIMENQYAYTTYQAIETQLAGALPHIDSPFCNRLQKERATLNAFENKITRKQQHRQSMPLHQRARYQDPADMAKQEMTPEELNALSNAYQETQKHPNTDAHKDAVAALNPEFLTIRQSLSLIHI